MSKPIYQLFIIRNQPCTVAFAMLSEAQNKELMEQNQASIKRVGAENLLFCDCDWANETYSYLGIPMQE